MKRFALVLLLVPALARAADMSGAFSIVARDPATDELGVAVLSRAPACGNVVPWVQAGVGAIATQGETNGSWGPRGLQLLREGVKVSAMVDSLMHTDDGFLRRQVGALDRGGGPAGYSGTELVNWSGGILDSNLAIQGNTMPDNWGLQALYDTLKAAPAEQELADRLLDGLAHASRLKSDWRGIRSAALLVGRANPARPEDASRYVYLRVDDDPDPVGKLAQLYREWRASRLVAAHLDYAQAFAARKAAGPANRETSRARAAVLAALADTSLDASALNAMAWALARRSVMLDQAWTAIERARRREPKSTEMTDTAAEIRLRQGRTADAVALLEEAHKRVPADEYIAARLAETRKLATAKKPN